ncbi:MAG: hypothetical protein WBD07_09885 [Vicinamibacterales bacterium]
MAEQLGDAAQRRTAHHEPGRKGVPQIVPREVRDIGEFQGSVKPVLDVLDRLTRARAGLVWEHPRTFRVAIGM